LTITHRGLCRRSMIISLKDRLLIADNLVHVDLLIVVCRGNSIE
jgi:hypothetical protein